MARQFPEQRVSQAVSRLAEPDRIVEVCLADLVRVFKTLEELQSFFHQPNNYQDAEALHQYLGDKDSGGYHLIHNCYYDVLWRMLPEDLREEIERFDV